MDAEVNCTGDSPSKGSKWMVDDLLKRQPDSEQPESTV